MADEKITQLPAATSVAGTDILPVVVDPGGIPVTKKITVDEFLADRGLTDNTAWAAKGDIVAATGNDTAQVVSVGSNAQKLISDSSSVAGIKWIDDDIGFSVIIGTGESVITTGVKGFIEIPVSFTIESWTIVADAGASSCVIDIWKDVAASFPPTDADSITAAATPTLSNAQMATNSTLTGWTTSCLKSEWLAFNVDSATTCKQVTLAIKGKRTATS